MSMIHLALMSVFYVRLWSFSSLMVQMVKNLPVNAGDIRDMGWIPGLGRSPGEGNGNPLQYSCLEIPWTEEAGRLQSMGSHRVGH